MTPPTFVALVDEYLAFRRGLGFELESSSWLLHDFARYADRIGHRGPITVALVVNWAQRSTSTVGETEPGTGAPPRLKVMEGLCRPTP